MRQIQHAMFPQDLIIKKRDGGALTREEIDFFVRGVVRGGVADYQASALLMAIVWRGMSAQETAWLTEAMMQSGDVLDLRDLPGVKVDKHSTGGVGDKVSLVLAPWVAACGVTVPMMSGRGLGHTGGTLDKLEAIPGFRTGLSVSEFRDQLGRLGVALIGQTAELVPADRKLYALRDVTGTVESIPLICASIMSKKLAEGIDALVLDVKFGAGAFMKTLPRARELAGTMVDIGRATGKPVRALLTAMDEPLGQMAGNALEVVESIECLKGRGPTDLMEVTRELAVHMLLLGGVARDPAAARTALERALASGSALEKFRALIAAQGGDSRVVDDYGLLPAARRRVEVRAPAEAQGFVVAVDALKIGRAVMALGGGRESVESRIDPAVGITALAKVGAAVRAGDVLAVLHLNDDSRLPAAEKFVQDAILFGPRAPEALPRIAAVLE